MADDVSVGAVIRYPPSDHEAWANHVGYARVQGVIGYARVQGVIQLKGSTHVWVRLTPWVTAQGDPLPWETTTSLRWVERVDDVPLALVAYLLAAELTHG